MSGLSEPPYFARVHIGDDVSVAAVIVMPDVLRQETREARTRQLEEVADRLKGRERIGLWIMDVIDLIAQAELLETESRHPQATRTTREHAGRRSTGSSHARTLSYEQFLAGRKVQEGRKPIYQQAFAGSDLDLVRSYLNRLIGLDAIPVEQDARDDGESVREALALRDEVPSDAAADAFEPSSRPTEGRLSEARRKQLEEEEGRKVIAARLAARTDIAKFSIKFCRQMRSKASEKPLVLQDMLRLRAVLMMMAGASCPIGTSLLDKCVMESQVLRPDGENAWARLIGRVLSAFFGDMDPLYRSTAVERLRGRAACRTGRMLRDVLLGDPSVPHCRRCEEANAWLGTATGWVIGQDLQAKRLDARGVRGRDGDGDLRKDDFDVCARGFIAGGPVFAPRISCTTETDQRIASCVADFTQTSAV